MKGKQILIFNPSCKVVKKKTKTNPRTSNRRYLKNPPDKETLTLRVVQVYNELESISDLPKKTAEDIELLLNRVLFKLNPKY